MSKRFAGIALLLALFATSAHAETSGDARHADADERVIPFGESGWELFRPKDREQTLFDLTSDLWTERAGLGLRFHSSPLLIFDLQIDPFTQPHELIGRVYDFDIGATILTLRFRF